MKLVVKTIKHEEIHVEVNPDDTVLSLKQQVSAKRSDEPVEHIVLIHSGKVLDNAKPISSYGISEGNFIVLVIKKPKRSAKPAAAASPPAAASSSSSTTTAASPAPAPAPASSNAAAAPSAESPAPAAEAADAAPAAPAPAAPAPAQAVSPEVEAAITNLCEMGGFPRADVEAAMRAAFNNADRAYEYLLTGIPAHLQQQAARNAPAGGGAGASGGNGDSDGVGGASGNLFEMGAQQQEQQQQGGDGAADGGEGGAFDFLRNNPQFDAMRALVQQNPAMLQPLLQQLGAANPAILQLIQNHQQEFIRIMNEPVNPAALEQLQQQMAAGGMGGAGGAGGPGGPGAPPPGSQYVQVTPEEREAIQRLCELGFDRGLVIQAYFACDKDEGLAANYLLEHGAEFADMEDDPQ